MKRIIISAALAALAITPAFATDWVPPKTYEPSVTQNNNQTLFNKMFQRQGQSQGQSQSATATGGNAEASASGGAGGSASANNGGVNVTNKTVTVVAPSISGNGDTNAVSVGTPFGAFGFALPTAGYKSGQAAGNIIAIGNDRALLYTQCSVREAHTTLMLKGIRCDLARSGRYQELVAYEASLKPVVVKKAPAKKKVRKARVKKGCGCK